jgi:hypothetical protein
LNSSALLRVRQVYLITLSKKPEFTWVNEDFKKFP